jgi:hypothetical protein
MIKTDRTALKILLLIVIFSTKFSELHAQNELPDSIVAERIQFIQQTLGRDLVKTKQWWYGWLAGYSAATVTQGAVYFGSNDKSTRQDMALGAATTFLGVAGQFISPIKPGNEAEQLKTLTENTKEEQLNKSKIAEDLLNEIANREKLARNWQSHVLPTAVDIGSGLVTWLAFDRSVWAGVGNFALNLAITETQIWTQPIMAHRNYKKYQQKYTNGDVDLSYEPRANWYIGASAGGASLKVVF